MSQESVRVKDASPRGEPPRIRSEGIRPEGVKFAGVFRRAPVGKAALSREKPPLSFSKITALQFAAAAVIFLFVFALGFAGAPFTERLRGVVMDAFRYNVPIKNKDEDIGKIKFVDRIETYRQIEASGVAPATLSVPVNASRVEVSPGVLNFGGITDGAVRAPGDGRVTVTGVFGGVKYIEIDHGGGIKGRCQGLTAAGAEEGERVRAGQLIGAAGDTLTFCLFKNGLPAASLGLSEDNSALRW